MKYPILPGKVWPQVGFEPMHLAFWVSTLTTRQLTPPLSRYPHPRGYARLDQGLDIAGNHHCSLSIYCTSAHGGTYLQLNRFSDVLDLYNKNK